MHPQNFMIFWHI